MNKRQHRPGKNVWFNADTNETIQSTTRPGLEWFTYYPPTRTRGNTYRPYAGRSEWEQMANREMADACAYYNRHK